MLVAGVLVGMDVGPAAVAVRMDMDQIIFMQKFRIGQKLCRRAAPYYLLIVAENIDDIRDLLYDVHVMCSGNDRLPVRMVFVKKTYKVS